MLDDNEIMAVNNGDASAGLLNVQVDGGILALGSSLTDVRINSTKIFVSKNGAGPSSPGLGDLWLDSRATGGFKVYTSSGWVKV
jgi:hypothetical protein